MFFLAQLAKEVQRQNLHRVPSVSKQASDADQSVADEAKERHEELLRAIRTHDWQSSSRSQVAKFSDELRLVTDADLQGRFCRIILARLFFQQMHYRAENISEAYSTTCEWIFQDHSQDEKEAPWDSLTNWLKRDNSSIYWITGKPGSGKSTLMKFLCNSSRLSELVEEWAKGSELAKASFYFWNSGVNDMQMSQTGLLQTILHSFLRNNRSLILSVFDERLEQFVAFGGGVGTFEWPELYSAFNKIIADGSKKFFFLIDGLDEFDGDPDEVIKFVLETARPNVKICTASRPWNQFKHAFGHRPNLQLENLTRNDIYHYVKNHFEENEFYQRLKKNEPQNAKRLVNNVVKKACGVFLWVKLVVNSLLKGLVNGDEMSHLQARLNELPSDLEDLFEDILKRLEPEYLNGAYELFRLFRALRDFYRSTGTRLSAADPTLLELYFANKENTRRSLTASWKPLEQSEANEQAERMSRRLNARCRGFLEANGSRGSDMAEHRVSYIHRTAKDFLESKTRWQKIQDATPGFDPDMHWTNAFLWRLKTMFVKKPKDYREAQTCCILHATYIQNMRNKVQFTYLNEVVKIQSSRGVRTLWTCYVQEGISKKARQSLAAQLTILLETSNPHEKNKLLKKCKEVKREFDWTMSRKDYEELVAITKYYAATTIVRSILVKPVVPLYE